MTDDRTPPAGDSPDSPGNSVPLASNGKAEEKARLRGPVHVIIRPSWYDGASILLTLVIAVVSGTYTYLAWRSAQLAEQASRLAEAAAKSNENAFKINARPYISLTLMKLDSPLQVGQLRIRIHFQNSGRTPALAAEAETTATLGDRTVKEVEEARPGSRVPVGPGATVTHLPELEISKSDVQSITTGRLRLTLKGTLKYGDFFNDQHSTRFCAVYHPGSRQFDLCEDGNAVD